MFQKMPVVACWKWLIARVCTIRATEKTAVGWKEGWTGVIAGQPTLHPASP